MTTPRQRQHTPGIVDLLAFACELGMLVILVAAGHGLAEGWRGWAVGIPLAFIAIGIWSQWMAPRSARRLENPRRFVVQVMLFVTIALYAAAGGMVVWGIAFAVVATAVFGSLVRTDP